MRKSLSKKLKFEVFKRDSFTCQYCGKSSPDAVLEIDHIKPLANGGSDELLNLVTACFDCNSGKGARELGDNSIIVKQQKQLEEMNERSEQLKMMLEWKEDLASLVEDQLNAISNLFESYFGFHIDAQERMDIRRSIGRFGFNEVYTGMEISLNQYRTPYSVINKLGGICYNRHQKAKEYSDQ